jgi:hypothetical protein
MSNFDLSALAIAGCCPGNEILYDDLGMPSIMVKIPKMTYAQLGMGSSTAIHPAFIVNGQEVDEIYISKYQNIVNNNRAYSLPGVDPRTGINFDAAIAACVAKGEGWHMMTQVEFGFFVRWCQHNGVMPKGNNNYGKHNTETNYKAIPTYKDGNGNTCRIATGTGPLTWYHDQTPSGVADLCGNIWEWTGGVRTVKGELQVLSNNNAADSANPQSAASTEWKAIKADDGTLITPNGSGTTTGSVKMDWISNKLTYSTSITDASPGQHSCTFANIVCDATISDDAKLLLANLGMYQYTGATELFSGHLCYFDNAQDERCFICGGNWSYSSYGLASFNGHYARSASGNHIGFRSAYIKLPS